MKRLTGVGNRFFHKLADDTAGNTLVMAAASLLPMLALIGGGVDVGRSYMAKTQLQSACDAGVLAGRRAMSKTGSYGTSERARANAMFNFNFDSGYLNISNVSFETDDNEDGQVVGNASARLPTLVMKVFDKDNVDLEVECMAELQIGNADIMFVLDVTGSMGNAISRGQPTKIDSLRDAVRDFHRTINSAVNDRRTRIRYGFVPYSQTVNARGLISHEELPSDYFWHEPHYQTRLASFETRVYVPDEVEDLGVSYETYSSNGRDPTNISQSNCDRYGNNTYPSSRGENPVKSGSAPNPVTSREYDFYSFTKPRNSSNGTCVRRVWTTRTTYETEWRFTNWIYQQNPLDASVFRTLEGVPYADSLSSESRVKTRGAYDVVSLAKMQEDGRAVNIGTSNSFWNGCIEERTTVQETEFDPIPDGAFDLDFDLEPYNYDTSWRPIWGDIAWAWRQNAWRQPSAACPAEMQLLRTVDLSEDNNSIPTWLNNYLNNLQPVGNTYHDIGMIWGGRLTSPTGLFAENVNLDADKISVSKHIIFMTDGAMEPSSSVYSAYGVESADHRIAPNGQENSITARHNARFTAMCNQIKAQGTTIWVVAFGTSMTTQLQNCASGGRAYYSSNTEALRNTFKFIAAQVADLRLGR